MSIQSIVEQMARQTPKLNRRLFIALLADNLGNNMDQETISRAWVYYQTLQEK